jgi:hypothetical protein
MGTMWTVRGAGFWRWGATACAMGLMTLCAGMLPAPAGASTSTVAVPITTKSDGNAWIVVVNVTVGGGPSVPVQLDTGSTGLVISSSAVGTHVTPTNMSYTSAYVSGTVNGKVEKASVAIGGLSTPSIAVSVVPAATARTAFAPGVDGIMGIAMTNDLSPSVVYSPLLQLATPYWQGVTVNVAPPPGTTPGSLVIGPVQAAAGAVALPMYPAKPSNYPNGRPAFQKDTSMCWKIGNNPNTCGLTDMDLGFDAPAVNTTFANAPSGATFASGQPVAVTAPSGNALWGFTTGQSTAVPNLLSVADLSEGYTQFNTSVGFFFANTLAYNVTGKQYLISPNPLAG